MSNLYFDPNYPIKTARGEITFAGVLKNYFVVEDSCGNNIGISKSWNEKTQSTYLSDYYQRLLPCLNTLCPIADYDIEDFDAALDQLQKKRHYSESTLNHYRHLIYVVCKTAYHHGLCDDYLWGTCYMLDEQPTESEKEFLFVRTKKSLSPLENLTIFYRLTADPLGMQGEDVGLLLMLLMATRNNETCGITYSDIRAMVEYPEVHCLWIFKSTERDSTRLKAGGKTRNANRVLPMFDFLYTLLMRRFHYIESLVTNKKLVLDGEFANKTVWDLPVACRGSNYTHRCSSKDLTRAGRELFKSENFNQMEMSCLDQILHSHDLQDEDVREKSPTTYLFRRNAATLFYQLGLTESTIQYFIGHDIEDLYITRNSFANEGKLFSIKQLLDQHPLNIIARMDTEKSTPSSEIQHLNVDTFKNFELVAEYDNAQFSLIAQVNEPCDHLKISVQGLDGAIINTSIVQNAGMCEMLHTVNIRKQLQNAYISAWKKLNHLDTKYKSE